MKSPIKSHNNLKFCLQELKQIIDPNQTINSFMFYDGYLELMLARYNRFVTAHTNKFLIYEFWKCLCEDPNRIYELVTSDPYKFQGERLFEILQRTWSTYTTGYPRAALFFLLNRCSSTGAISGGRLDNKNFHPMALNYLKSFERPDKFNLKLVEQKQVIPQIEMADDSDFIFLPIGKFSYNLFDHGKNKGIETTHVNNQKLRELLDKSARKIILVYNFHPHLSSFFKKHNQKIIGPNGFVKADGDLGDEVIVTNF